MIHLYRIFIGITIYIVDVPSGIVKPNSAYHAAAMSVAVVAFLAS
jgi:hypothetical protein